MDSSSAHRAYHYESLGDRCVRFLELFSDLDSAPLRCRIFTSSLDSPPEYEALSYVWGPQEPCYDLDCGRSSNLPSDGSQLLHVGPNLHDALLHLRSDPTGERSSRILWVDRICIDQNDSDERSSQVQLMGEIYENSKRTIAWLGLEDEIARIAFNCADYVYHKKLELGKDPDSLNRTPDYYDMFDYFTQSVEGFEAVAQLTDNEYFKRGWIMQEAILPPRVVFQSGRLTIPFEWLLSCCLGFYPVGFPIMSVQARNIFEARSLLGRRERRSRYRIENLPDLLDRGRDTKVSDPHDHVYSILGLFDPKVSNWLDPDYSKPVEDAFIKVANCCIRMLGNLHVLHIVKDPKLVTNAEDGTCPTWVPDYRCQSTDQDWTALFGNRRAIYDATRQLRPEYLPSLASRKLEICGVHIGNVQQTGECTDLQTIAQFDLPERYGYTNQPISAALRQCMTRGQIEIYETIAFDHEQRKSLAAFFGLSMARSVPMLSLEDSCKDPITGNLAREGAHTVSTRSFMTTDSGHIGFGPKSTAIGDHIFLLLGSEIPFVLRPAREGYRLVGTCYVHGIMVGEGLHPKMGFDSRRYPGSTPRDDWKFHERPLSTLWLRRPPTDASVEAHAPNLPFSPLGNMHEEKEMEEGNVAEIASLAEGSIGSNMGSPSLSSTCDVDESAVAMDTRR